MEFAFLITLGYAFKGMFGAEVGVVLSKLIVNFTLPSAILFSFATSRFDPSKFSFALTAALSNVTLVFLALTVFSRVKEKEVRVPLQLSLIGFNTGLFMYPLAEGLWGAPAVLNYAFFDLGNSFFIFGVGKAVSEGSGVKGILKVFSFPPFLAVVLGLALNYAGVGLPAFVLKVIQHVKNANAFLVFFLVGYYLNFRAVWRRIDLVSLAMLLKYVSGVIISFFALRFFSMTPLDEKMLFLGPLLPSAVMTLVYTVEKGYDGELASGLVTLSTVFSYLVILLTNHLWG